MTPLVIAIMRNDIEALKEIVRPHSLKQGPTFDQDRNSLYVQRKQPEQYLLDYIDSGEVSSMAYGT